MWTRSLSTRPDSLGCLVLAVYLFADFGMGASDFVDVMRVVGILALLGTAAAWLTADWR
jgi:hypothetical protein